MSRSRKQLTAEEKNKIRRQDEIRNNPNTLKAIADLHRNPHRPISSSSSLALELLEQKNVADENAVALTILEDIDMETEEESKPPEKKADEPIVTDISRLKKRINIDGMCFIPLRDGKTFAFIQGSYDKTLTSVHIWDVENDQIINLNHKKSANDFSRVEALELYADRYLIAAVIPCHAPKGDLLGRPIEEQDNELLIWDLNELKNQDPLSRYPTISTQSHYHMSVITDDNILMICYLSQSGPRFWQTTLVTFQISPNGLLHNKNVFNQLWQAAQAMLKIPSSGLLQNKNVFSLTDGTYHVGLSQKGLIFELGEFNEVTVRNSKGTMLGTHYFGAHQGNLIHSLKPLDKIGEEIYAMNLIDPSTLTLKVVNESHYIVDITKADQPKQIGYVDADKLPLVPSSFQRDVDILPMKLPKNLVALHQGFTGTLFLFHLKENKIMGQYKLNYQEAYNVDLQVSLINQCDLISSQYECMRSGENIRSISVQRVELLHLIQKSLLIENILYEQYSFPRTLASLTADYLYTRRDLFFTPPSSVPTTHKKMDISDIGRKRKLEDKEGQDNQRKIRVRR